MPDNSNSFRTTTPIKREPSGRHSYRTFRYQDRILVAFVCQFGTSIERLWGVPGIDDWHSCHIEVAPVARDDGKAMLQGSCRK